MVGKGGGGDSMTSIDRNGIRAPTGGLLMSGRRPNSDSGEPDSWSNGSVFMRPREPIWIDPSLHIPLQQSTATADCDDIDPYARQCHALHCGHALLRLLSGRDGG